MCLKSNSHLSFTYILQELFPKFNWKDSLRIISRVSVWKWCDDFLHLKGSPIGSRFKSELTPWLREPLVEFGDNKNREITCQCCVQGGKSTVLHGAAVWATVNDCSSMFITCQTDADAMDFAKERLNPSFNKLGVEQIDLPKDRTKRATCYISLPNGFILIQGANENNLQSKSVRWILNDEVYRWKKGLLDEVRKRGTRFWNRRILNCSTAGNVGDDIDRAFESGDKRVWHLQCPSCKKLSRPMFARLKWDKEACLVGGEWDYNLLKKNVCYECEHCHGRFLQTPEIHSLMNAGGVYLPTNSNPDPQTISFQWNSICLSPSEISWGELAVEWIKAEAEWKVGNEYPRREFITKRLAESWSNEVLTTEVELPKLNSDQWTKEKYRFLTVDVQEDHYWALVQGWSDDGEDFIHFADRIVTIQDVRALQHQWSVPDTCVLIDSAFDSRRIYAACVDFGWTAMRGEDVSTMKVAVKGGGYKNSFYSWPPAKGDPNLGKTSHGRNAVCSLIRWAKRGVLDIAGNRREGRHASAQCTVSPNVGEHFQKHMFAEQPRIERDKRGREFRRWHKIGKRPNHLWDCYCMGIVGACMVGVIGGKLEK